MVKMSIRTWGSPLCRDCTGHLLPQEWAGKSGQNEIFSVDFYPPVWRSWELVGRFFFLCGFPSRPRWMSHWPGIQCIWQMYVFLWSKIWPTWGLLGRSQTWRWLCTSRHSRNTCGKRILKQYWSSLLSSTLMFYISLVSDNNAVLDVVCMGCAIFLW